MKKDKLLFQAMKEKYVKYTTYNFLKQCKHEFDTQMNEGMNNSVAFYAAKGQKYATTTSLKTRVFIAAGVQLVGHHYFWTSALISLSVSVIPQFELALLNRDKKNAMKFFREHDHKNMAKRNRL